MLPLLTSRFTGPIASALALILAGLLTVQTVKLHWANGRVGKLEAKVATIEHDRDTWKANFDRSDAATKACSASVAALEKESAARVAESDKATKAARSVAESYRRRAEAVLSTRAGDDKCQAAARMIAEAVG